MTKEAIFLGIAGIILGITMIIKNQNTLIALIPTIIGIALILFYKEEDKIENRKDIKQKKSK